MFEVVQNPSESLITGSKNCTAMFVSICTACSEYSLESSINFEKGERLKVTMNRRRKRDREPSRIPLKRILKVLNKKNIEKRYSCLLDKVFQRVHLSLIWVKTTKYGNYGTTEILFIANMPSPWRHRNVRWGKSIVAAYTAVIISQVWREVCIIIQLIHCGIV